MAFAGTFSEGCRIRRLLIERAAVFSFSANVPANEGADVLSYLFTSELMLILVTVLIALLLVARYPEEH
jgi:hypothetical protein